ncbi:NAD(P)H-binding protein [Dermatophilaceae bacterium Soc4.6]
MITLVGGTGRLGRQVAAALVAQGRAVRVVSRHAGTEGADPERAVAELVAADVADPRQARAVVDGSTAIVAAMTGMDPRRGAGPRAVDRDAAINLIDAAAEFGCHLVLVSVVGAALNSPIELFRMKAAAEAHLKARDLPWTIVRATAFAETWADIITASTGRDGRPRLLGPARNPMNFVPVADVAATVIRAIDAAALRGRCVEVDGPENLSLTDLAARLTGRPPRHLPTPLVRTLGWAARPLAPGLARIARQAIAMEHLDLTRDDHPLQRHGR